MANLTYQILEPQYYHRFACCGSSCEDSCCSNWHIVVDKTTYQLYRECSDAQLKAKMKANVTRVRTNANKMTYAKIKMDANQNCPFLDENMLCEIQKKLGEDYLSFVCRIFPRITNLVNGVVENSLSLACPEAARIALLNKRKMEFDLTEVKEKERLLNLSGVALDTRELKYAHKPQVYFWELRTFIISLIQNRSYPLWKRLIILGLFCDRVTQLEQDGKVSEMLHTIQVYQNRIDKNSYDDYLDDIADNSLIQIELVNILINPETFEGGYNPYFQECFSEYTRGFITDHDATEEKIFRNYSENYHSYYQQIMAENEHILENYLVNYIFQKIFPFKDEQTVFDNYVGMIVNFAMVKTLLIGMSGFHREKFSEEHIIKTIHVFGRVVEHNAGFLQMTLQFIKDNGWNTMPYMAALIKN